MVFNNNELKRGPRLKRFLRRGGKKKKGAFQKKKQHGGIPAENGGKAEREEW